MVKPLIEPGAQLDGFTIGECVHHGGMATLWTVTHPGINVPLLMKVPRVAEGEDPATIVSFEMDDDRAAVGGGADAGRWSGLAPDQAARALN